MAKRQHSLLSLGAVAFTLLAGCAEDLAVETTGDAVDEPVSTAAGDGGAFVTRVDASDMAAWRYFSFATGSEVIPADPATLKTNIKMLINNTAANMASAEFTVPSDGQGGGHVHKFKLTAAQVTTLKGGGMVTGIVTYDTTEGEATHATGHTHTYTIACAN